MGQRDMIKAADGVLAVARILLALLFLIFGWQKLLHYSGTTQYLMHVGAPLPALATVIAIIMEFFVGVAIILGLATRPLAVLLAIYTLGTALIAHRFWTMTGVNRFENQINFYKNLSIIGGLLTLHVAGAGRYSVDCWWSARKSRSEAPAAAGI